MKFKVNTEEFKNIASIASKMANNGAGGVIFSGLYLNLKDNILTISSTDRETTIIAKIDAKGTDGTVLVSASLFVDILRRLSNEESEFIVEKETMKIISGKTKFDIPIMDANEYPTLDKITWDASYAIDIGTLTDLISSTVFAAAPADSSNVAITGGNLIVKKDAIEMVALDGYRLAIKTAKTSTVNKEFNLIIPAKVLSDITHVFPAESGELEVSISKRNVCFKRENITLISSLISDKYPDFSKPLGVKSKYKIKVDTRKLKQAVDRVSLMSIGSDVINTVRLNVKPDGIKFFSQTGKGIADDFIDCKTDVDDFSIAFNNKFLADALKSVNDDEVYLNFGESNEPCKIEKVDSKDDNYLYIVYPMRV